MKLINLIENCKTKCEMLAKKKVRGVNGYVVTAILIIVAIGIGVIFRDQLEAFFIGLFGQMNTEVGTLW